MSTNHEHTPTTEEVREVYRKYGRIDGPMHSEQRLAEFDRFLAAAEQRGAERALRDVANDWLKAGNDANVYAWLHYRADQESDDE